MPATFNRLAAPYAAAVLPEQIVAVVADLDQRHVAALMSLLIQVGQGK